MTRSSTLDHHINLANLATAGDVGQRLPHNAIEGKLNSGRQPDPAYADFLDPDVNRVLRSELVPVLAQGRQKTELVQAYRA